jgi:flagellar export protein FliJ
MERAAKLSFAEAEQACRRAEAMLDEMRQEREAVLSDLCGRNRGDAFDPAEAHAYQDYLCILTQSIKEQELFVRERIADREVQKLLMIGKSQEKQVIVKLKDRDRDVYQREALLTEQKDIDEIATTRHAHRLRGRDGQAHA